MREATLLADLEALRRHSVARLDTASFSLRRTGLMCLAVVPAPLVGPLFVACVWSAGVAVAVVATLVRLRRIEATFGWRTGSRFWRNVLGAALIGALAGAAMSPQAMPFLAICGFYLAVARANRSRGLAALAAALTVAAISAFLMAPSFATTAMGLVFAATFLSAAWYLWTMRGRA